MDIKNQLADILFIFSLLWYTHAIRIRNCNWTYFEPHRLAEVLWLLKSCVIWIIFHAEIFNIEISESFAVGNEISVKIKTYSIYCPYRYNNHLEMRQYDSSHVPFHDIS